MISLLAESCIWWAVVIIVAICRIISRSLTLGSLKRLQLDDCMMAFALCFYSTLIVTINLVAHAQTNLLPPNFDLNSLTPLDIHQREFGSKLVLVVEQCQIATIWLVKACILTMYLRITFGQKQNLAIKILAGYVAFGFVFMEIFYFGVWCRPFHDYWAVPTPNVQCDTAINHLIVNAVFNLSSDTILLSIALPMFIKSRIPARKKIALCGIFGLGFFVILSAILNKYYSFTDPFGSRWTYWYTREASTALLVANLPFMWPLMRRVFKLKSLDGYPTAGPSNSTALENLRSRTLSVPFQQGLDPESGRHFSDSTRTNLRLIKTPTKEGADLFFLTTPSSFADSGYDSQRPDSVSNPQAPARCVLRDSLSERRASSTTL